MILTGIGMTEMPEERQAPSTNSEEVTDEIIEMSFEFGRN